MKNDFKIIPAERAHRTQVTALLLTQLHEHSVDISERTLLQAVDGVLENPNRGALWIALLENKPVGVAYLSFIWALEHGGRSAWLEELYVLPEHRKQGLGNLMLDEVTRFSRDSGCAALDLEVEADHKRVESLYRRNEFRPLTRARWVKKLKENL